ncbi:MAG TPA: EamA family transporter [Verrucomicrobiales bacterium]|nr:EamA family transporter [Verrucomicrobiales bacterium]HIL68732.1 EamA family transporter [Verrucomicrobiota bacterium]
MFAALFATILFSVSAVTATRTSRVLGANQANFWRLSLAMMLLGIWAHVFGQGLEGNTVPVFIVSGIIGFGIGDVALFHAYPRLGSRLTLIMVHCLAAPIAAVTEYLWLDTTLTWIQIICGITILLGVVISLAPSESEKKRIKHLWTGVTFGLIAATGQGLGAVVSRKAYDLADQEGISVDGMTAAYQRIIGGMLITTVFYLWTRRRAFYHSIRELGNPEKKKTALPRRIWLWVIINGLSGPTLGVSCYQWALQTTPTGIVLPIVATTPLVVIPFSRFVEGEKPQLRSMVGGAIAVFGAAGLSLSRLFP